jgi:hypothetical protein
METWATFSIIDHLKPIGDQTQEELDQLEAVDYLREAQVGEPSFCVRGQCQGAPAIRGLWRATLQNRVTPFFPSLNPASILALVSVGQPVK